MRSLYVHVVCVCVYLLALFYYYHQYITLAVSSLSTFACFACHPGWSVYIFRCWTTVMRFRPPHRRRTNKQNEGPFSIIYIHIFFLFFLYHLAATLLLYKRLVILLVLHSFFFSSCFYLIDFFGFFFSSLPSAAVPSRSLLICPSAIRKTLPMLAV